MPSIPKTQLLMTWSSFDRLPLLKRTLRNQFAALMGSDVMYNVQCIMLMHLACASTSPVHTFKDHLFASSSSFTNTTSKANTISCSSAQLVKRIIIDAFSCENVLPSHLSNPKPLKRRAAGKTGRKSKQENSSEGGRKEGRKVVHR